MSDSLEKRLEFIDKLEKGLISEKTFYKKIQELNSKFSD